MMLSSDAQFSTAALILGLGVAGLMYWMEKRPRQDLTPRLFPTTLVLLLAIMLALGAGVHLMGLAGLKPPQH
jgi:putative exporter of polyketide antibiotics